MSRNSLQYTFNRIAESILPPWIDIKEFAPGTKLHPELVPVTVDKDGNQHGGGFDNTHTVFGLIQPASHGRTLIARVAEDTEKAIAEGSPLVAQLLQRDLQIAIGMWDSHAVPHEQAVEKTVKL